MEGYKARTPEIRHYKRAENWEKLANCCLLLILSSDWYQFSSHLNEGARLTSINVLISGITG